MRKKSRIWVKMAVGEYRSDIGVLFRSSGRWWWKQSGHRVPTMSFCTLVEAISVLGGVMKE